MKKFFNTLIALVLVLSLSMLASCGKDDDKDPGGDDDGIVETPIVDY